MDISFAYITAQGGSGSDSVGTCLPITWMIVGAQVENQFGARDEDIAHIINVLAPFHAIAIRRENRIGVGGSIEYSQASEYFATVQGLSFNLTPNDLIGEVIGNIFSDHDRSSVMKLLAGVGNTGISKFCN